jgi:hypothetical protein
LVISSFVVFVKFFLSSHTFWVARSIMAAMRFLLLMLFLRQAILGWPGYWQLICNDPPPGT